MRNLIIINTISELTCDCVEMIGNGTNSLYISIKTNHNTTPYAELWFADDLLLNTYELARDSENLLTIDINNVYTAKDSFLRLLLFDDERGEYNNILLNVAETVKNADNISVGIEQVGDNEFTILGTMTDAVADLTEVEEQIEANKAVHIYYKNPTHISVLNNYGQISRIDFTSIGETSGYMVGQVNISVTEDTTLLIRYVKNGIVDDIFIQQQEVGAGNHTISIYYPLEVIPATTVNSIRVQAKLLNGIGTIITHNIQTLVVAMGVSTNTPEWDGNIEIDEATFTDLTLTALTTSALTDNVATALQYPQASTLSDDIALIQLTSVTVDGLTDDVTTELITI